MDQIGTLIEQVREQFTVKNTAREQALQRSRSLISLCAHAIRAVHREEWPEAAAQIAQAGEQARALMADLQPHPDLYHAGYTQDALKEYVEACLTHALVRDEALPTPEMLEVGPATYLGGLTEAATELRRRILDIIRRGHSAEAERLLGIMDVIYSELMTLDFPDAITDGLRRRTDVLRGVLERTRGDLTNSLRQQQLQEALRDLEKRLDTTEGPASS